MAEEKKTKEEVKEEKTEEVKEEEGINSLRKISEGWKCS